MFSFSVVTAHNKYVQHCCNNFFFSLTNETIALDYQRLFENEPALPQPPLIPHGRTLGTRLEKTKEIEFTRLAEFIKPSGHI